MYILIENASLISMNENRPKIEENIDILIEDDKIKTIGKNILKAFNGANLCQNENVKIIDATEKLVMPGLINTHAHLPMSIFRETIDGYGLQEWLEEKIWPMEDKLTKEDIYYATYLSCIEMIKTGCTTINDMYFMTDEIIKAAIETGIRLQTTRTLMSETNDSDERMKELKTLLDKYKNNDTITFNTGIHGLYTTKEEDVRKFIEFAKNNDKLVHIHFCENSKEVEDIKRKYKVASPVDVLEKYFTNVPTLLAHAVKLNDAEIERISKLNNISVSHCPVSNLKLGCGIANVSKMAECNINVTLGTDGQGSGSNLSLFETMKYTALLQKGIHEDPKVLSAYDILKMATINGAKALGLQNKIGSIDEGKQADLIMLNIKTEEMQPVNDIFSDIVYNAKGHNVELTIVNGNILMENRKLCFSEDDIYHKCKEIIDRIR